MRLGRVKRILKAQKVNENNKKNQRWYERVIDNFEKWVKGGKPFVQMLRKGTIDYWNFNSFFYGQKGDPHLIAVTKGSEVEDEFTARGYKKIKEVDDIVLLKHVDYTRAEGDVKAYTNMKEKLRMIKK